MTIAPTSCALAPAPLVQQQAATVPSVPAPTATAAGPAPTTTAPATSAAADATAGAGRLTTVAPGGSQSDADLVEGALETLRRSTAGAVVVDRLLATDARINVVSDAEFAAMGQDGAHAFYDPKVGAMYLRRTDLQGESGADFAAVALAHEGVHMLDDTARVDAAYVAAASRSIAAGSLTQEQARFELTMIREARAFTFAGQVARELGVQLPQDDPTHVAASGANDQATYAAVWAALLGSSYNPEGRAAAVQNF